MKKSMKLTLLLVSITFIIFIFLIINNNLIKNKIDEQQIQDTNNSNKPEHAIDNTEGENNNMNEYTSKINININGNNYIATLEDNDTTREFLERLPLEINMKELNGNEKYYYFDDSFPNNPSQVGKINSGDLMLYGNDCLVLFYESFDTPYSYTRLGKIDNPSDLNSNVGEGNIKITFLR